MTDLIVKPENTWALSKTQTPLPAGEISQPRLTPPSISPLPAGEVSQPRPMTEARKKQKTKEPYPISLKRLTQFAGCDTLKKWLSAVGSGVSVKKFFHSSVSENRKGIH